MEYIERKSIEDVFIDTLNSVKMLHLIFPHSGSYFKVESDSALPGLLKWETMPRHITLCDDIGWVLFSTHNTALIDAVVHYLWLTFSFNFISGDKHGTKTYKRVQ